jgi:hypothetical protein
VWWAAWQKQLQAAHLGRKPDNLHHQLLTCYSMLLAICYDSLNHCPPCDRGMMMIDIATS